MAVLHDILIILLASLRNFICTDISTVPVEYVCVNIPYRSSTDLTTVEASHHLTTLTSVHEDAVLQCVDIVSSSSLLEIVEILTSTKIWFWRNIYEGRILNIKLLIKCFINILRTATILSEVLIRWSCGPDGRVLDDNLTYIATTVKVDKRLLIRNFHDTIVNGKSLQQRLSHQVADESFLHALNRHILKGNSTYIRVVRIRSVRFLSKCIHFINSNNIITIAGIDCCAITINSNIVSTLDGSTQSVRLAFSQVNGDVLHANILAIRGYLITQGLGDVAIGDILRINDDVNKRNGLHGNLVGLGIVGHYDVVLASSRNLACLVRTVGNPLLSVEDNLEVDFGCVLKGNSLVGQRIEAALLVKCQLVSLGGAVPCLAEEHVVLASTRLAVITDTACHDIGVLLCRSNDGERCALIGYVVVVAEVDAQRDILCLCSSAKGDIITAIELCRCLDTIAYEVASEVYIPSSVHCKLKLIIVISRNILEGNLPDIVCAINLGHLVQFSCWIPANAVHPSTTIFTITGNKNVIVFKRFTGADSQHHG